MCCCFILTGEVNFETWEETRLHLHHTLCTKGFCTRLIEVMFSLLRIPVSCLSAFLLWNGVIHLKPTQEVWKQCWKQINSLVFSWSYYGLSQFIRVLFTLHVWEVITESYVFLTRTNVLVQHVRYRLKSAMSVAFIAEERKNSTYSRS